MSRAGLGGSDATLAESTLYTIRMGGGAGGGGGGGGGGELCVFTSARSAVPPYSLPILASRTRLN